MKTVRTYLLPLFFIILLLPVTADTDEAFDFRFAVIADMHLELHASDDPEYFKLLHQSEDLLRIAIDELNQINSDYDMLNDLDFVLFLGDNINGRKMEQYTRLYEILKELTIPFFLVNGDWDYTPDYSPPTVKKYFGVEYENLNENALFEDSAIPEARKYDFSLDFRNSKGDLIHLIGMDNVLHFYGDRGSFEPEQIDWLENDLRINSEKPVVIFAHNPVIHPFFSSPSADYDDVQWIPYTRKLERELAIPLEDVVMDNPWWTNRAADRSEEFLEIVERYRVPLVLMGDYHLNKRIEYPSENPVSLLSINPALVSYPCAYTIYEMTETEISWEVHQIKKYAEMSKRYDISGLEKYNQRFQMIGTTGMLFDIDKTLRLSHGDETNGLNDWCGTWHYEFRPLETAVSVSD